MFQEIAVQNVCIEIVLNFSMKFTNSLVNIL